MYTCGMPGKRRALNKVLENQSHINSRSCHLQRRSRSSWAPTSPTGCRSNPGDKGIEHHRRRSALARTAPATTEHQSPPPFEASRRVCSDDRSKPRCSLGGALFSFIFTFVCDGDPAWAESAQRHLNFKYAARFVRHRHCPHMLR